MTEMTLFAAPGAVSRAILMVIEEKGIACTTRMINFQNGDQSKPEFLAVNPKGRVPALVVDGTVLTETVAILAYLDMRFPEHAVLPGGDPMTRAQAISDMAWMASGVHPNFPRIFRTVRYCDREDAQERVREQARDMLREQLALIDQRLAGRDWWYDGWSAMDAYVHWAWLLLDRAKVDGSAYPNLAAHAARMAERPSTQRALAHESA